MQAIANTSEVVSSMNQIHGEDTYVIKIEMMDGTSQLVHLSIEQAIALGLQTPNIEKPSSKMPTSILNYKIIQPADLNLGPKETSPNAAKPSISRGRPKKRPVTESPTEISSQVTLEPKQKVIKTSRTRSGRITRPPIHMERDFEKIITEIKPKLDSEPELNTVEFEPIKTSNPDIPEPALFSLETKKRLIPAQYRCTTCKKAYMGRSRMARHLKKYPDHGNPGQSASAMEDSDTWSCLVETALKANKGQRGAKFCRELINLINNARILAKYFFKPAKSGKEEYIVDSLLADVLRIKDGGYRFNENELCKDVGIFSFLFYNDEAFMAPEPYHGFVSSTPEKGKPAVDLHFGDNDNGREGDSAGQYLHIFNDFATELGKPSEFQNQADNSPFHFLEESKPEKVEDDRIFNQFLDGKGSKVTAVQDERTGKEVDICRNTISNILTYGASDEHMSSLLDKEKKTLRKSDEFDLHKLHLDELIIQDTQGHNLLDTSTGSVDYMNVDQFVNERFKNLTEPEGSLNLDLPVLECFNFNG